MTRLLLLTLIACAPVALAVVPARFGSPTNFPAGGNPAVVVSGDFNNDTNPDLALSGGNGFSLLLGTGRGAFGTPSQYPVSMFGNGALATGDFNKDGHLDLVETDWYSTRIMLGDGTGNLTLLTNMQGDHNFSVYSAAVAVGDLNGDGKADLAVANTGNPIGRGVTTGLGLGNGFFGAPTNRSLPTTPSDIALGDLDGDGRLDAAVSLQSAYGANSNSVCVLTNNGSGVLGISRYYDSTTRENHPALKLADFDANGGLDLAILNYTVQTVTIRLNPGNGSFGAANDFKLGFQATSLATGDFNGDENTDLFVRGATAACVLAGHGDGFFTVGSIMPVASGANLQGTIAADDFDKNGLPDAAFACMNNGYVAITLNQTPPFLKITPMQGYNQISWFAGVGAGFNLESTTNIFGPSDWQPFPYPAVVIGNQKAVTDWTTDPRKFYRLKKAR